jgi:hypothetical protein
MQSGAISIFRKNEEMQGLYHLAGDIDRQDVMLGEDFGKIEHQYEFLS